MKTDNANLIGGSLHGLSIPAQENAVQILNSLSMAGHGQLMRYNGNAWELLADLTPKLYEFTTFTFTPAGSASGRTAPTLSQLNTAYGSAPFVGNTDLFNIDGFRRQLWTVPQPGTYDIVAKGASLAGVAGAPPAQVSIRLTLEQGEILTLAIGQQPASSLGGSGGTTVYSNKRGLLCVAGGAGGTRNINNGALNTAVSTDTATTVPTGTGGIGKNYSQGSATGYGAGGAGHDVDGNLYTGTGHIAPSSFTHGSIGGGSNPDGGFGGGGGGDSKTVVGGSGSDFSFCCGGGGGFIGGEAFGGSGTGTNAIGGGGSSFTTQRNIVSRSTVASAGTRGPGSVKITKVD